MTKVVNGLLFSVGQPQNRILQTDIVIDFLQPFDEKSGDVCDTNSAVSREEDFNQLAESLLSTFESVTKNWAYFEKNEKEVA